MQHSELKLVEVPTPDNGKEVLWVHDVGGLLQIVSVPVFTYGISRDAIVAADPRGTRLELTRVLQASPGATVRCYMTESNRASDVYREHVEPAIRTRGLQIRAATVFDPEIIAVHIVDRHDLTSTAKYFDTIAGKQIIRFWELSDPEMAESPGSGGEESSEAPWELIHPLPVEGQPARIGVH